MGELIEVNFAEAVEFRRQLRELRELRQLRRDKLEKEKEESREPREPRKPSIGALVRRLNYEMLRPR